MTRTEFEKKYISSLNSQQKEAVQATEGPVLLLAVPGSGKTTVLVHRLGYMLYVQNVPAESILTMTYTVAATQEMRARFASVFGSEYADRLEFRTINGLSQQIIDYYGQTCSKRRPFDIEPSDGELSGIIREIYLQLEQEYPDDSTIKDIRTAITYIKNMMLSDRELEEYDAGIDSLPEIFRQYNAALRERQRMDYDDQLLYALTILKTKPSVLEHFRDRFVYYCVDEAQDTSKVQHAIIRILAKKRRNIFMVGDEDQSIYGFRAACPEALMNFSNDYPGARILYLEQNYRSTPEIISSANRFISRCKNRYDKKAVSVRSAGAETDQILFSGQSAQYRFALDIAQRSVSETAFLFRNNDSAVPLIDLFERNGVSYNCRRFDETFFSHRIISDIRDIAFFSSHPSDTDSFLRIYYKFSGGITKKAAMDAVNRSALSGQPILKVLGTSGFLKPYARENVPKLAMHFGLLSKDRSETALSRIWYAMGYGDYVKRMKLDENKFGILTALAKNTDTLFSLIDRLDELQDTISSHCNTPENKIVLSTIHSSKGLEYDRVYLIDVFNGVLPSLPEEDCETEEDRKNYEEDRRIFYVAMTRAKNELHLCNIGRRSDFLRELFPEKEQVYGDFVSGNQTAERKKSFRYRNDISVKDGYVKKNGLLFPQKK